VGVGIGNRESQVQKLLRPPSSFPIPYSLFPIPYSLFPVPCPQAARLLCSPYLRSFSTRVVRCM